ncbi:CDT1-like protein a, chloroplastic [Phoenix dactylifera]|uniref:CDT1-like protein a, chloroplastic n=1 Tax=Phoenix dactylifera TaxID=42345 RepID=A0A8B7MWD8_PHODC|nr:CDT1-like protein a, chloroplastic [Phoenix dactylifera]
MESLTTSELSTSTDKKPSSSPCSPIKSLPPAAAALSPSKAAPPDQIWTPEKPVQLLQRARNRSVALSVKEVKNVALGLQRSAGRSDLLRSDGDLLSIEEHLGAGSGVGSISKPSKAKTHVKLSEKYEILCEFFNCMESSIRLLRLKGTMSTFSNICTSIQHLTERRFTYGHLAQLKYIMPEAVLIKKVLSHDETTCCMKPELQVTLQVEAIANSVKQKDDSGYSIMRKIFRERLVEFFKGHPEGDDIPEEQLPHPFSQAKQTILPQVARGSSNSTILEPSSSTPSQQQFAVLSHISGSFQRRFSQKIPIPDAEKTSLISFNKPSLKDDSPVFVAPSPIKFSSKPPVYKKSLISSPILLALSGNNGTDKEDAEKLKPDNCSSKDLNNLEGTPAKLISTPARLMTTTPEIQTSKRSRPAMGYDTPPPKKSVKRSARTKLFTTPTKNTKAVDEDNGSRRLSLDDDVLSFLPETLLQSIREKEKRALEEKEAGVANAMRRQKLIACLPNIFDGILLIFQSANRSVMTKQELIYKIIASHCKIADRGEVEEQLELLLELVPDWISEKKASSGDILCCVNKITSPEEIRQRLAEVQ